MNYYAIMEIHIIGWHLAVWILTTHLFLILVCAKLLGGEVDGYFVFNSNDYTNNYYDENCVLPVVSLKSDIINIDAGYNETTGWSLK